MLHLDFTISRNQMAIYFYPEDRLFIEKMGYDRPEHNQDLKEIYNLDIIVRTELHMSIEEEAKPYFLANFLYENPRYAERYIQVAVSYEDLARSGQMLAKARLAYLYRFCNSLTLQNKALKYAYEAANAGHIPSQYLYGLMMSDYTWVKKAADSGYHIALCLLGKWYYNGDNGLKKDVSEAKRLWLKSQSSWGAYEIIIDRLSRQDITYDQLASYLQTYVFETEWYHYEFTFLCALYYSLTDEYREAYRWCKLATERGLDCYSMIERLYDKGFVGDQPRSYWENKHAELQGAMLTYQEFTDYAKTEHLRKRTSVEPAASVSLPSSCEAQEGRTSYHWELSKIERARKARRKNILTIILIIGALVLIYMYKHNLL